MVLTTGCDKTTPSAIMAAATVDIPAIVLSGGPMLDGWHDGHPVGAGTIIWQSRRRLAAGEITEAEFFEAALSSSPSLGHCNTMGTASTMNAVAEALGLSLTGCAAIPAVYGERGRMAYETGRRIVELAYQDIKPSDILTRASLPQRHEGRQRDRWLIQRPAAHHGHGPPRRGRDHTRTTGWRTAMTSLAGQHAAGGERTSASVSIAPAACRR